MNPEDTWDDYDLPWNKLFWAAVWTTIILTIASGLVVYILTHHVDCRCYETTTCQCDSYCTPCKDSFVLEEAPTRTQNIAAAHSDFNYKTFSKVADDWGYLDGYSMEPTIFEGNSLLLMNITEDYKLKPGEIVRYSTISYPECKALTPIHVQEPYTIHRIRAIYSDEEIHLQGDNMRDGEVITRCQITHIVVGVLFT